MENKMREIKETSETGNVSGCLFLSLFPRRVTVSIGGQLSWRMGSAFFKETASPGYFGFDQIHHPSYICCMNGGDIRIPTGD